MNAINGSRGKSTKVNKYIFGRSLRCVDKNFKHAARILGFFAIWELNYRPKDLWWYANWEFRIGPNYQTIFVKFSHDLNHPHLSQSIPAPIRCLMLPTYMCHTHTYKLRASRKGSTTLLYITVRIDMRWYFAIYCSPSFRTHRWLNVPWLHSLFEKWTQIKHACSTVPYAALHVSTCTH